MLASYRRFRDRTVRVHTTNGSSVEGVLANVSRDYLELRGARFVGEETTDALQGDSALMPFDSLDFLQVL